MSPVTASWDLGPVLLSTNSGRRLAARLARTGWLLCILLLGAGCQFTSRQARTQPLELDFAQVLPAGWQAVGTWQEVNIDADDSVEYLLFFSFDQGQVGAAIFDTQIASDMVGMVDLSAAPAETPAVALQSVPLQPLGSFRPYRLLPSNWSYVYGGASGQGVVALPKDRERVLAVQIGSGGVQGETADGAAPDQPQAELLIRGGDTHLTFVWWRDAMYGYGVTQLAAEGGFRGVDWEAWSREPAPITEIAGLYPLTDYRARSLLCRETLYRRIPAEAAASEETASEAMRDEAAGLPVIAFREQDRGIKFCREPAPAHPYYPEGAALAYLSLAAVENPSADQEKALEELLTPDADAGQIAADAGIALLPNERVEDIATHPTVPALPANLHSGVFAPTTVVCVELAQQADPKFRRWVVLTLRYQPPDLERGLPERWTVSGAAQAPSPAALPPATSYCESILTEP